MRVACAELCRSSSGREKACVGLSHPPPALLSPHLRQRAAPLNARGKGRASARVLRGLPAAGVACPAARSTMSGSDCPSESSRSPQPVSRIPRRCRRSLFHGPRDAAGHRHGSMPRSVTTSDSGIARLCGKARNRSMPACPAIGGMNGGWLSSLSVSRAVSAEQDRIVIDRSRMLQRVRSCRPGGVDVGLGPSSGPRQRTG